MVGVWGEGRAGEDGEAAPVQAPGEGVVWGWDLRLFQFGGAARFGVVWAVMVCSPREVPDVVLGFLRGERRLQGFARWRTG